MTRVKDLLGKSGGRAYPGTKVKFRKTKSGPKISSVKSPKFKVGDKLNLR